MSQESVEVARAYFDQIARASREDFDTETTISKMAEFWDPELEWDASEAPFDLSGVGRGVDAGDRVGIRAMRRWIGWIAGRRAGDEDS